MKMQHFKLNKGFTLVELLLYLSILIVVVGGVVVFMQKMLEVNTKMKIVSATSSEATHVLNFISQKIRNAESVTSPTNGNVSSVLSLDVHDLDKSPTVFNLINGKIFITEGAGAAVELTSARSEVSNLLFTNLGLNDGKASISTSFRIDSQSVNERQEYNYVNTYEETASIRN